MSLRNLVPSIWGKNNIPVKREEDYSLSPLQRDMNRLFDDFFKGFGTLPFRSLEERMAGFSPSIDIRENDEEISIKADLPGLDEKDIEVQLSDNVLTIKGEKKEEKEDQGKDYYHVERTYGAFHRIIPLHASVDEKKVAAQFKNGVLTISLSKAAQTKSKKIAIKAE